MTISTTAVPSFLAQKPLSGLLLLPFRALRRNLGYLIVFLAAALMFAVLGALVNADAAYGFGKMFKAAMNISAVFMIGLAMLTSLQVLTAWFEVHYRWQRTKALASDVCKMLARGADPKMQMGQFLMELRFLVYVPRFPVIVWINLYLAGAVSQIPEISRLYVARVGSELVLCMGLGDNDILCKIAMPNRWQVFAEDFETQLSFVESKACTIAEAVRKDDTPTTQVEDLLLRLAYLVPFYPAILDDLNFYFDGSVSDKDVYVIYRDGFLELFVGEKKNCSRQARLVKSSKGAARLA